MSKSRGVWNLSKTPPKINEQIAGRFSQHADSHGNQYFGMRSLPSMSQG
jgi:hypothetical protein